MALIALVAPPGVSGMLATQFGNFPIDGFGNVAPDIRLLASLLGAGFSLPVTLPTNPTFINETLTGLLYESATTGVVAGTTRTQAGATPLTKEVSRVDTSTAPAVGTILGDGVLLPVSGAGLDICVINNTINPVTVYPAGSDQINGQGASNSVTIPPFSCEAFECPIAGSWYYDGGVGFAGSLNTVLSASGITAAGTTQGTATALVADINRVINVGAGAGVVLPAASPGLDLVVVNRGTNPLQVYGSGTDTIDAVAASIGVAQMQSSVCIYACAAAGLWDSNGIGTGYAGSFPTVSFANSLTAKAGGGQSAATPITTVVNRYTTVATNNDSATLPPAQGGVQVTITNAATNSMNVFPNLGDQINGAGANISYALAGGKTANFSSAGPTFWHAVLSA